MPRSFLSWLVASLVVLVAVVAWMRAEPEVGLVEIPIGAVDPAAGDELELSSIASAVVTRSPDLDVAASSEREAIAAPKARDPRIFEVLVVRAEDDAPIAGAEVSTGFVGVGETRPTQKTGADGITRWRDNGGVNQTVTASAAGRRTVNERLSTGSADAPPRVVLRLESKRELEVRLVDARGQELQPAALGLDPETPRCATVALSARCAAPGSLLEVLDAPPFIARPASWDARRFAWHLEIRGPAACCVNVVVGDLVLASLPVDRTTYAVDLTVDPAVWARVASPFVVRAVSADDGRALVGVDATVRTASGFSCTLATDAEGRARFEGRVLASEFDVEIVGEGCARTALHARRSIAEEVVLRVPAGRTVSGVVLEADGRPSRFVKVCVRRAADVGSDAPALAQAEVGADGRFSFPWMPAEELVVVDVGGWPLLSDASPALEAARVAAGRDAAQITLRFPDSEREPPAGREDF